MAAQALYRRWRSQTFAQIIGQDHVTHTLLNALRARRISHAYLFAGPRGTGKTTTARVLAKAVNCLDPQDAEPCNRCAICRSLNEGRSLDLIEIDAASNRGIDDIRDLREKIAFSPSECRYKVYVVDEAHMLTEPAFNALLKTLEEPPPHAIFVLATTAPHHIPTTILSRCQRFDFRRVSLPHLKQKLELICTQEAIRVEPTALDAIARYAAGSFRDAESLLDQLASYGTEQITVDDVRRVLGSAPEETITGIVQAVVDADVGEGLRWIGNALDSGVEARQLTREVLEYLRSLLLIKNGGADLLSVTPESLKQMAALADRFLLPHLLRVLRLFNGAAHYLKGGMHTQLPLELALVEATLPEEPEPTHPTPAEPPPSAEATPRTQPRPAAARAQARAPSAAAPSPVPEEAVATPATPAEEPVSATLSSGDPITVGWLRDNWGRLLHAVRPHSRVVEALLKSCEPIAAENDLVTLGFYHSFHKEQVAEDKNRVVVEQALSEVAGRPLRARCVLHEGDRKGKEQETEADRREKLLDNPMVHEAIHRYGARVVDVQ